MYPEVDQVLYSITIFCSKFSYTKRGSFYWVFRVPYKKNVFNLIVPILAALFSERNNENCQKSTSAKILQQRFQLNFLPVYFVNTV